MALLTATELLNSREAQQAGLTDISDAEATEAIAHATALLNRVLGYRIEVTDATITVTGRGHYRLFMPERVRTITSVTDDGDTVDVDDRVLEDDGWTIRRRNGGYWTFDEPMVVAGTFGFTTTDEEWTLAKKAVLLLAVRQLQGTSTSAPFPTPAGAQLTGFASENASFTFDRGTAEETRTGYADVDRLIEAIGYMPTYA